MNTIKYQCLYEVDSTLVHSKKNLLIVKLRSFQNASVEIKQIFFVYQQNRFTQVTIFNLDSITTNLLSTKGNHNHLWIFYIITISMVFIYRLFYVNKYISYN